MNKYVVATRKFNARYSPLLVVTLLAACSMQPSYERPALPVAAEWAGHTTGTRTIADTDIAHYFPDARLQKLISVALESNRDLRIATARIAEAEALYGIQHSNSLPTVALNADRAASLTPAGVFFPQALRLNRYDVNVGLVNYELDFWGRVRSLNEAAKASYLATEEAQRAFRLSLVSDVANAYLSAVELRERVALTVATLKGRSEARDMVARRYTLGASSDIDNLQAEGAYQTALADRASLEQQLVAAENLLNVLVGKSVAQLSDLPAGRTLAEQGMQPDLIAGLPAEVLLQRPDVLAAEQRLIAANANIGAARAAFFPTISLTGNTGFASNNLSGLFASGNHAWSFNPTISLPLFDGGRSSANFDLAQARKIIAVADYEKTIQQAFREVADLLSARDKLAEQMNAQTANAQTQQQRLKLVDARYQAGVSNYLEVLDAQRDAYAAEQNSLQVRRAWLSAINQLYKALAGETAGAEVAKIADAK